MIHDKKQWERIRSTKHWRKKLYGKQRELTQYISVTEEIKVYKSDTRNSGRLTMTKKLKDVRKKVQYQIRVV